MTILPWLSLLIPFIVYILGLLFEAFGLPIAVGLAHGWIRLAALSLRGELRHREVEERFGFLNVFIEDLASQGYKPHSIALQLAWNLCKGAARDVMRPVIDGFPI